MERLVIGLVLVAACTRSADPPERPPIDDRFDDDFERAELGPDWFATRPDGYEIINGALNAKGAVNHPLWLRRALPENAVVELDVWAASADADLKVEIYGDGASHARDRGQYTSSGYVAVMGGWSNSISVLVAGNEHRPDRAERRAPKVEVGRRYHWKLVKRASAVEWFVDDMERPFLRFEGGPLGGPGHQFLAINNWESDAWFDNLSIQAL